MMNFAWLKVHRHYLDRMNCSINWIWLIITFLVASDHMLCATVMAKTEISVLTHLAVPICQSWISYYGANSWFGRYFYFFLTIFISIIPFITFLIVLLLSVVPKKVFNLNWVKSLVKQFCLIRKKFGMNMMKVWKKLLKTAKNSRPMLKNWKDKIEKPYC